jgi:hypothetical protein
MILSGIVLVVLIVFLGYCLATAPDDPPWGED